MQKKLLALAVAGALAPAAAMAQSTVEIYGRANLGVDKWKATGSAGGAATDYKSRMRVFDGSSRLGFRINESLGGGMRAFAVIETGINIDSGSQASQAGAGEPNASSGLWASRDSYLGLGGGWGDVRFGRQSIWWAGGVIAQAGANYLHTAADSVLTDSALVAIPVARQSNVVSYNSPTMGGFNASISYAPNSEAAGAGANTDAKIYGVTGRYTGGPIRGQIDWAKNEAASPTTAGTPRLEITGLKIGLGYAYAPGSLISGWWGRLENDGIAAVAGVPFATAGANLEQDFWLVNLEHMIGQWQLIGQYYKAMKVESSAGGEIPSSESTAYTLAAKYFLSKRTGVYLSFNKVKNEANAFKDFSGGGISSAQGSGTGAGLTVASRGADVSIIALGVMHNF